MQRGAGQWSVVTKRLVIPGIAAWAAFAPCASSAETPPSVEAWRTSPFHGAISGATGEPIPCLCRFRGQNFKLGDRVCMQTPDGIVITRCDMLLNNTTWVPTDESCTMSRRLETLPQTRKSASAVFRSVPAR